MEKQPTLRERAGLFIAKTGARLSGKSALAFGGSGDQATSLQSEITASLVGGVPIGNIRISTDSLFTIWRNHGDVFGCVRELVQGVGVAGYYWENAADQEKDPNPLSVKTAEGVLTFYQTIRQWKQELIRDVSVGGNVYYHLEKSMGNGSAIALQRIDPRTMSVVTDKYGTIIRWIQRVKNDTVSYKPEEILHFKTLSDPNSPVFGISPLEPILWEVRTDLAAMVANYSLFENDSVPAAMYILDDEIPDTEQDRAVKKLQEQLKGAENRHKSIAMKGLKDIKQISISNKDMEFSVLRNLTTEKVCAAYGVPKSILGYTDAVNLANGEEQTKKFWESSIEPIEEQVVEFVNKQLLPALGISDIKFAFEARKFDNREWNEASTRADLQLGIMTINEVREERGRQKFDPVEMGDLVDKPILYGALGARPLEDVGVDPSMDVPPIIDEVQAQKELMRIESIYKRTKYGAKTDGEKTR